MTPRFATDIAGAIPVTPVDAATLEKTRAGLSAAQSGWTAATGFAAALAETCCLPGPDGRIAQVLIGLGSAEDRARTRFATGAAIAALPQGTYRLEAAGLDLAARKEIGLAALLAGYRFGRYRDQPPATAQLIAPEGVDAPRLEAIAAGECLTRDLINTPAEDMGPADLAAAAEALARDFGATCTMIVGEDLITQGFPMIHAVGRAAARAPRLIEMTWGDSGPTLTLVGKGVCFDTGGLNLKPGASMALMKKDMGGAATVLGLARMIMALKLELRLRVLIPAVENAVSGAAMRPGDILRARDGKTVEINNTDAEGRLVLADALCLANETPADLTVSMATLTGAARVAVGPDIAPFFTDDDALAARLARAATEVADPVWRLPFHAPYESMIDPGIADLDNAPKGGFAGAITAALFLRRFVSDCPAYLHFDIYGWQPAAAPARPKGGVGQGARAILQMLADGPTP